MRERKTHVENILGSRSQVISVSYDHCASITQTLSFFMKINLIDRLKES